ncbi:MAG TPA: ABC transporter permease [Bacteroidales bacterium]|nr:ABC transporter permease [Bacteroidales bacterium]
MHKILNNTIVSLRNLKKSKINSVITIAGLSVASACILLIYLYVSQELTFNNFHENKARIFRINYSIGHPDGAKVESVYMDPRLSEIIKSNIPQVKRCTVFRNAHKPAMRFGNHYFEEENTFITENDFFTIFSFKLLIGNKDKIFTSPGEIVITSALADKLAASASCKTEELIGKDVFFAPTGDQPFIISGIMEDVPKNSSIRFDALIPYRNEIPFNSSGNMFGNSSIFYETSGIENIHTAEEQINKLVKAHYNSLISDMKSRDILISNESAFIPYSLPITETYLSRVDTDYEAGNSKTNLYILSVIGFLILVIACSNYILLSVGQTYNRRKQVGIRKVMGAGKTEIFSLFFTESMIITSVSIIIGVELCFLLFPVFNGIAINGIYRELISIPKVAGFLVSAVLLIVMATSMFPIIKLSAIKTDPVENREKTRKLDSRGIFITIQYALSLILIILAISIVRQTNYMKNEDLGFLSDNMMYMRIYQINNNDKLILREKLRSCPGITNMTLTDRDFIDGRGNNHLRNSQGEYILTRILNVDKDYISTLNLKLIEGENFTDAMRDNQTVIINEQLQSHLLSAGSAVGQILNMDGRNLRVAGVVKDFHFDSMKDGIEPLILILRTYNGERGNFLFIKYLPGQADQVTSYIRNVWKDIAPGRELDLRYWDSDLSKRYEAEEKWSRVIGFASVIAIIISSLGLLGLTVQVINRRIKEIGIRKINGASVPEVMIMLNTNFIKWIAFSFILACPVAYYIMHKWLENFANKSNLSLWVFIISGFSIFIIALLTVSLQTIKAATRNPVEALRYE